MNEVTDTNTETSQDETKFPRWLYWFFGGVVLLVVFLLGLYFSQFNNSLGSQESFAQFGDFVGGTLNPVLGFATVALLIWSINVQMRELRLTREELAATKVETAMSRQAMQDQVKHLEKEAKLSEITRLLKIQKDKYEYLLASPIRDQNSLLSITGLFIIEERPMTCADAIKGYYSGSALLPNTFAQLSLNIRHTLKQDNNNSNQWQEITFFAMSLGHLTNSYLKVNPSHDFATVFLYESKDIIDELNNFLGISELKDLSSFLKNQMDNFYSE